MNNKPINDIKPFIVMDVLEKAIGLERSGHSIIHLEIGEPDFHTPKRIVESCMPCGGERLIIPTAAERASYGRPSPPIIMDGTEPIFPRAES